MNLKIADKAGFCFGVNRAVNTVYAQSNKNAPVSTCGPIFHLEEVSADLSRRGGGVVNTVAEAAAKGGTIILRSHGITRALQEELEAANLRIVDATCPYVKKIHRIVEEYSDKGYFIVIVGSSDHPEVEGIVGWTRKNNALVIKTPAQAAEANLPADTPLCIVAQTTFHHKKFQDIVEIIRKKGYDSKDYAETGNHLVVCNTICSATRERQEAARQLSGQVDAMIVIGGASSSNTRKLYEICSEHCKNTYFIQTKEDLETSDFSRFDYVGITAGASTPNNIIEEVQKYVRNEF